MTLRQFLDHTDSDKKRYHYQTLVDNVSLLTPEVLGKVNQLIVESGHTVVGKKPGKPLRGRCVSFVVDTNVHYPTDVNLLLDALRCMLRHAGPLGSKPKVPDWRQWMHLLETVTDKFNKIRKTRRARRKDIKAYLKFCTKLVGRVKALLLELAAKGVSLQKINRIEYFAMHAVRQIDQIGRRLLKGETLPQNEKVFSIFEPHTRWVSKGKAGRPVELGVPIGIAEDQYQFILHYEIMWTGSDVDFAVPLVEITKELFPDVCAARFDRGFHSPANRTRLDECQCTFKSDPILLPNNDPSAGRKDRWGGAAAGPARGLARRRLLPTCRAKFSGWLAVTSKTHQNSLATSKDQWHRPPTMMPHFQSEGRRAAIRQPPSSDGGKARHRIQLI